MIILSIFLLFAALVNHANGCECEVIDAETSFANSGFGMRNFTDHLIDIFSLSRVVVENVTRPDDSILVGTSKDGLFDYRDNDDAEIVYIVKHVDVYKV